MTMKIVRSKEEFIAVASEALFNDLRDQLHDLDNQAADAGMDDPDLLLLLGAKLAAGVAAYTAYLTAGMYLAAGKGDKVVAGALAALEDDIRGAMGEGMKLAIKNVAKAMKDTEKAQADTDALLKKVVKTWKN
jgi:hypothetical protein